MDDKRQTFRLYLLGRLGKSFPVRLACLAEFGENRAVEYLELTEADYNELLALITGLRDFVESNFPEDYDESTLQRLGEKLFKLVFFDNTHSLMNQANGLAKGQSQDSLPLEIFVEDPQLASFPWEYMYDEGKEEFICQNFYPVSRGIFSYELTTQLPPVKDKVRILILIGVLPDDASTNPDEEVQNIENVFKTAIDENRVEFDVLNNITVERLKERLEDFRPHILHFFGHGKFDNRKEQGCLKFESKEKEPFFYYARDFAQHLRKWGKEIRLVFLNACESGRASEKVAPGQSSVAAALLKKGVPAVIANQFAVPFRNAQLFSAWTYDNLIKGKSLSAVVSDARTSHLLGDFEKFTHWGIPVLYTISPEITIFPALSKPALKKDIQAATYKNNKAVRLTKAGKNYLIKLDDIDLENLRKNSRRLNQKIILNADRPKRIGIIPGQFEFDPKRTGLLPGQFGLNRTKVAGDKKPAAKPLINFKELNESFKELNEAAVGGNPSITLESTVEADKKHVAKLTVALVDFDANAGFLPKLVQAANKAQSYYNFQISYLPIPSGALKSRSQSRRTPPQFYVSNVEDYLKKFPEDLSVDRVCCLTKNMIAGKDGKTEFWNHFSKQLDSNPNISIVSTYEMREYAFEAGVSYARAVFFLCLSEIVMSDETCEIDYHDKTEGCLFDYCEDRHDIVQGLRKMKLDHQECRNKITDKEQLKAIDALLKLKGKFE